MFRRLSEPLPLSAASLLLFRPALNAPVLNVGWLPVGPARAAVVVFAEEYGGIGVALGLRATESGQLAVVRNQESIDFDVPIADALEPLLAEAERMGFLFDEDLLETLPGEPGRSEAMTRWAELMGELDALVPPRLGDLAPEEAQGPGDEDVASGPLSPSLAVEEAQYPELILDDVAPLELDGLEAEEASDRIGLDATETLDPEDELELGSERGAAADVLPELEPDFGDPLELEHDFEDALEDALGDPLDDDWAIDDPVFGESDLTEPTAPVAAARGAQAEGRPQPTAAAVGPSAPVPDRAVRDAAGATPDRSVGAATPPPPTPVAPVARSASALPAAALPAAAPPAASSEPCAAVRREGPPRVVLSKFRQVEEIPTGRSVDARSEVGADRSSELARIPIVRVRREREPGKRVPLLARLLSSF